MGQTPQLEAIDTNRVDSFFIWQEITDNFAKNFYLDFQSLITNIPDSPQTYLEHLKKYHTKAENHGDDWSHLAEILDLLDIPDAVDLLRQWYKSINQVDRNVEAYIQRLVKVPNLENQHTYDVRLYDFIDCIRPLCITFVEAKEDLVKKIKKLFFQSLNRSLIELRLLDNLKQKFIHIFNDFDEVKIAFRMVEEQGAFKHFDSTYGNMALQIKEITQRFKVLAEEFELVDDDKLMLRLGELNGLFIGIDRLILDIPKQATYDIQGFEHGAIGSDVFEIIQKINVHLSYVDWHRDEVVQRFAELMAE